jgi:hypothetical protein
MNTIKSEEMSLPKPIIEQELEWPNFDNFLLELRLNMEFISMARLRQLEGNNFTSWIFILIRFYNTEIVEIIMIVYMTK